MNRKYCGNRLRKLRCDLKLQCSDEINQQRQKELLEEMRRNRNMSKSQKKSQKKKNKNKKERKRDPDWNPKYKLKKPKKIIKFEYKKINIKDIARIQNENEIKLEKELEMKKRELEQKGKDKHKENDEKSNDKQDNTKSKNKNKTQTKSMKKKKKKGKKQNKIIPASKALEIPLFLAERAWSYSRELYGQYDEDHKRKIHHSNSRLRKAIEFSRQLTKYIFRVSV